MSNIGINGFGRIGRLVLRAAIQNGASVVAINDPFIDVRYMVYLFSFDSTHGRFNGTVVAEGDYLVVNGKKIKIFWESDPAKTNWADAGAEYIVETTGLFTTIQKASAHFQGGAKKVIISAPSADAPMFICGLNLHTYDPKMKVVSSATCTTNCLAPLTKIIHDHLEIVEEPRTTIQPTGEAKIMDGPFGGDSHGTAVGKVNLTLDGKLTGMDLQVPIAKKPLVELTVRFEKCPAYNAIKQKVKEVAQGQLKDILSYTEEEVDSSDSNSDSSIKINDSFVKLVSWYDREYSYSNHVIKLIRPPPGACCAKILSVF